MATTTTRLALRKPATSDLVNVTTDISDNMDKVDAAVGFERLGAFPGSPYTGKPVMRSDQADRMFAYDGTSWEKTQGILIYADTTARDNAFTSVTPVEGDFAYVQSNNILYVYEGGGWKDFYYAAGVPRARLKRTTAQSLTTSTDTAINWTGEDLDSHGGHDNAVNNTRYTAQAGGLYLMTVSIPWGFNATGKRQVDFRKNGTTIYNGASVMPNSAARIITSATRLIDLAFNDYIEIIAHQNSGGNLDADGTLADGLRWDIVWTSWAA